MSTFKFVPVDQGYSNPENVIPELMRREKHHICNRRHVGAFPREVTARMSTLPEKSRCVILSQHIPDSVCLHKISPKSIFPFCFLHRNGGGITYVPSSEALRPGNYFVCEEFKFIMDEPKPEQESPCKPEGVEYRYHVDINEIYRWRNDPPYVNMDRTSDEIGQSSWAGNLVSWFRCGFRTRLMYAVHSGLLPEE